MDIRLTGTEDFGEFCEDVQFNDYQGKAELSTWFGQSSFRWTFLRHNLELVICDHQYFQPVIWEQEHDDFDFLVSKFFLSGGGRTTTPNVAGVSDDYEEVAGYNYLFYLPNIREFEHFNANQRTQCLGIYWYPELLDSFQGSFDQLPALLQQLIQIPLQKIRFQSLCDR